MKQIAVYSSNNCAWCVRAKALLESKGLEYEEIDISQNSERALEMVERTGRRTVPQVFINNQAIGGFDELSAMNRAGKLD